jgi:hypothetical protein
MNSAKFTSSVWGCATFVASVSYTNCIFWGSTRRRGPMPDQQEHQSSQVHSNPQSEIVTSFDDLAKGLASGTLSRGKALRWMGGALVGAALASLPGVAWAEGGRCSTGRIRCNDNCVNLQTSERHCGSCGNRCRSTQTCCKGKCVNTQTNERHCGGCSNRCDEGEECVAGVCEGGEPICTPSCPSPCFCADREDGTGPVCIDCSQIACEQLPSMPSASCADCPTGTVCVFYPTGLLCGNPCQA